MKKYKSLLLALAILLMCGCSFNVNVNSEKTKSKTIQKKKVDEVEKFETEVVNSANKLIATYLLDLLTPGDCGLGSDIEFPASNKISADKLNDSYKFLIAYHKLYGKNHVDSISKADFIDAYKKVFNVEPKLENTLGINTDYYELDSSNNNYVYSYPSGSCAYVSKRVLDNTEFLDDTISFSAINYFVRPGYQGENLDKYYISNDSFEPNYSFELDTNEPTDSDIARVKNNKDKFTQYKFNFKLIGNNYTLISIEKIN